MRVISIGKLRDFWQTPSRGDAEQALRAWYREAEKADWTCWSDIKAQFGSADSPGNGRVVFNIGGNKYRLIVKVEYRMKKVFVRWIGTHKAYDELDDVTTI